MTLRSFSLDHWPRPRPWEPRAAASGPPAAASPTSPGSAAGDPALRRPLLTNAFRSVLLLGFLGFGIEQIVRVILPLMVLDGGGNAALVGILAGAFALPSVLFRPLVGRLADQARQRSLLRVGASAAMLLPLALLLPGIAAALIVRVLQGSAWAVFSVANQALMARVAPRQRRAEASALYMTMPALATFALPAIAVALFAAGGAAAPLIIAALLGLAAFAAASRLADLKPIARTASSSGTKDSLVRRLVEPSAVPGTLMLIAFGSTTTLFSVFAPVYAAAHGIGVEALILYYPLYGLAQVVALPLGGRVADRIGRRPSIALGTLIATVALGLAVGGGLAGLALAAVTYAVASALVNPTISAMTIERAPQGRLGSAIATYSIGYQVANGLSAVLWGAVITVLGYPWPFFFAAVLQLATLALSRRSSSAGQLVRAVPAVGGA